MCSSDLEIGLPRAAELIWAQAPGGGWPRASEIPWPLSAGLAGRGSGTAPRRAGRGVPSGTRARGTAVGGAWPASGHRAGRIGTRVETGTGRPAVGAVSLWARPTALVKVGGTRLAGI